MKKRDFLVVYDYGQGGVWAFLTARSRSEIERRFPELRVFERAPDWMSKSDLERIRAKMSFDLDRPTGWFATFLRERGEGFPSQPRPSAAG